MNGRQSWYLGSISYNHGNISSWGLVIGGLNGIIFHRDETLFREDLQMLAEVFSLENNTVRGLKVSIYRLKGGNYARCFVFLIKV